MENELLRLTPKLLKIGVGISVYIYYKHKSKIRDNKLDRFHEVIENEDYDNALWQINRYIEDNPKDINYGNYYKSVVLGKMDRRREGIELLEECVNKNKRMYEALKVLGDFYLHEGDVDKALDAYSKVKKDAKNGSYFYNRGLAQNLKGEYRKAVRSFRLAQSRYEGDKSLVYYGLIQAHEGMGNTKLAKEARDRLNEFYRDEFPDMIIKELNK